MLLALWETIAEVAVQIRGDEVVKPLLVIARGKWCGQRMALGIGHVLKYIPTQGALDKVLQTTA